MPFGIIYSAKPLPIQIGFLLNQKWFPGIPWESLPQLKGTLETSEEYSSQPALIRPETALEGTALGHSAPDLCPELFQSLLTTPRF